MLSLIYVFDPLCGWCYGNGPGMNAIAKSFQGKVKIDVIPGGMVMKQHAQPMSALRGFLTQAIPTLEQTTGVKISDAYRQQILANDTLVLNSEVPSMAYTALAPFVENQVALASAIQELLFVQGLDTNNWEVYQSLFTAHHPEQLVGWQQAKASIANREATYDSFKQTQTMGVRGFPALLVAHQEQFYMLASGYAPEADLSHKISAILQEWN